MKIPFTKMSGSGNDFILIDHRTRFLDQVDLKDFARKVCQRRISVGADGLILIEKSDKADFKWQFFNSDGSVAEMCGNGGRCAALFAHLKGIAGPSLSFETLAGIISAWVNGNRVKIQMTRPHSLKLDEKLAVEGKEMVVSTINTGVPHAVVWVENLEEIDVTGMGRAIRFHSRFAPAGSNANFVRLESPSYLSVRTYERGVEGETLACGTGDVAAALIAGAKGLVKSPVSVRTQGGEILTVYFEMEGKEVKQVFFEGDVRIIYEAELWEDAYK